MTTIASQPVGVKLACNRHQWESRVVFRCRILPVLCSRQTWKFEWVRAAGLPRPACGERSIAKRSG